MCKIQWKQRCVKKEERRGDRERGARGAKGGCVCIFCICTKI